MKAAKLEREKLLMEEEK